MVKLYHSIYIEPILYGTHKSGFYSCINEVRNSLYKLITDKIYPKKISFSQTLDWYRDSEDLYDILYKTDLSKINKLKDKNFNFKYFCPTELNLNSLNFEDVRNVEDVYFLPSKKVLDRIEELEKKYSIDYSNTLAILHRGTDKGVEAKLLPLDDWISHIKNKNDKDYKILIQTDELSFKEGFCKSFPNHFFFNEMIFQNNYVLPTQNKVDWSVSYEAIMRIIAKCDKIITHSGNTGIIPILHRGNLKNVSQCYQTGNFINFNE